MGKDKDEDEVESDFLGCGCWLMVVNYQQCDRHDPPIAFLMHFPQLAIGDRQGKPN